MRIVIDEEKRTLIADGREMALYSREAFSILSRSWLRVGWDQKYVYGFAWMGRPIIQLPEDLIRIQELIYRVKPTSIIETGVAHGGSLVYYASLCKATGLGRVVGIDVEIRTPNRAAIEAHELSSLITLIEGNAVDPATVLQVRNLLRPRETVLVVLDSNHTKAHVRAELEAYGPMVSPGSYIIATDGAMEFLADTPRGRKEWIEDNPRVAAREFAEAHAEFALEEPVWPFNEGEVKERVTLWPGAFLRRRQDAEAGRG